VKSKQDIVARLDETMDIKIDDDFALKLYETYVPQEAPKPVLPIKRPELYKMIPE
jgi:hypothetical protein